MYGYNKWLGAYTASASEPVYPYFYVFETEYKGNGHGHESCFINSTMLATDSCERMISSFSSNV